MTTENAFVAGIRVYTDGSSGGKTDEPGGWAAVIYRYDPRWPETRDYGGGGIELSGSEAKTTNQRMEIMAAIRGLEYLEELFVIEPPDDDPVFVYSDSAYVVNCIQKRWYVKWKTNGWLNGKRQAVANRDLWQRLLLAVDALLALGIEVEFRKVKGHADDIGNNRADQLAVAAKKREQSNRKESVA